MWETVTYQKQLCFYTEKKNHGVEATDLSLLIIQFFLMSVYADNHGVGGVLIVFFFSLSLSHSLAVSSLLDYET